MPVAAYYLHDPAAPRPNSPTRMGTNVLLECCGRLLLEQRWDCGAWGLPGGRLRRGESEARECREELGAEVHVGPRVDELVFDYPDLSVHLTLYQAEPLTEPRALEHSALDWVGPAGLERYDLCPADRRFVPAVQQWFSEQEKAPAQQAAQRPQTGE